MIMQHGAQKKNICKKTMTINWEKIEQIFHLNKKDAKKGMRTKQKDVKLVFSNL